MRTSFWRVAYDESKLSEIISSGIAVFPDFSRWPTALNNSEAKVRQGLRVGHYLLLANFDDGRQQGAVRAVGQVQNLEGPEILVDWRRNPVAWDLGPNPAGIIQWRKEAVFCFDVEPAKRYKLEARTKKLFEFTGT